ncbi:winged helix-turn-helix transcriptional regulator [Rhizobium panacihumi]|uniref:winged helix-turn-helix transcriptional regulator n=1 Tax=Rhizobium panacihumi TaxID=2008450 RepID=UPI003D7BEECE
MLFHLLDGTLCLYEIRRRVPGVTQRMLTNQLREMEEDGLITRKVYAQVPPKVEYSLSDRGRGLAPILLALKDWGGCPYGPVRKTDNGGRRRRSGSLTGVSVARH